MNNRLSRSDAGVGCFVAFRLFVCEWAVLEGGWDFGFLREDSVEGDIAGDEYSSLVKIGLIHTHLGVTTTKNLITDLRHLGVKN